MLSHDLPNNDNGIVEQTSLCDASSGRRRDEATKVKSKTLESDHHRPGNHQPKGHDTELLERPVESEHISLTGMHRSGHKGDGFHLMLNLHGTSVWYRYHVPVLKYYCISI